MTNEQKKSITKLNELNANGSICCICEETKPTHLLTSKAGSFKVCQRCAEVAKYQNDTNNRIKESLYRTDKNKIFTYTLGWNLLPNKITITPLESNNEQ